MALRIFENAPDDAPKERFSSDLVGRLRSGYQVNKRPVALKHWRVTTGDPDVARYIAETYEGDKPQTWDAQGEDNLEVFTKTDKIKVIFDGPSAIRQRMVLRGFDGLIRVCDGAEQLGVDAADPATGRPCECPSGFNDRKDAAKAGRGCKPDIVMFFTLADAPDMGKFKFASGSWSLVKDLVAVDKKLTEIDGPASAWLRLEEVVPKDPNAKRFTKPVVEDIRAVPSRDASASDEPPF